MIIVGIAGLKTIKIARWMSSHKPIVPYDNATPVLNLSSSALRFFKWSSQSEIAIPSPMQIAGVVARK